jgi:hypothetical protein
VRSELAYSVLTPSHEERDMPIRIASLSHRLAQNGATLHLAMTQRIHSLGADHEPSETEQALAEERRALKEERARRQAHALEPRPKAADRLVRTHHPEAKEKPKAKKEPKETKGPKTGKAHATRAEKHAAKAAAMDAARRAAKKTAKP